MRDPLGQCGLQSGASAKVGMDGVTAPVEPYQRAAARRSRRVMQHLKTLWRRHRVITPPHNQQITGKAADVLQQRRRTEPVALPQACDKAFVQCAIHRCRRVEGRAKKDQRRRLHLGGDTQGCKGTHADTKQRPRFEDPCHGVGLLNAVLQCCGHRVTRAVAMARKIKTGAAQTKVGKPVHQILPTQPIGSGPDPVKRHQVNAFRVPRAKPSGPHAVRSRDKIRLVRHILQFAHWITPPPYPLGPRRVQTGKGRRRPIGHRRAKGRQRHAIRSARRSVEQSQGARQNVASAPLPCCTTGLPRRTPVL
mmetsp:Transcript_18550/g.30547  ORF Transcript_18550/g.30547 Transcript_18550/m.30547 type:complete len:307 (-) Transcript_18550:2434-3354(-)